MANVPTNSRNPMTSETSNFETKFSSSIGTQGLDGMVERCTEDRGCFSCGLAGCNGCSGLCGSHCDKTWVPVTTLDHLAICEVLGEVQREEVRRSVLMKETVEISREVLVLKEKSNEPNIVSTNVRVKDNGLGTGNSKMGLTLGPQKSSRKEIMDRPLKRAANGPNKNQQLEQLY